MGLGTLMAILIATTPQNYSEHNTYSAYRDRGKLPAELVERLLTGKDYAAALDILDQVAWEQAYDTTWTLTVATPMKVESTHLSADQRDNPQFVRPVKQFLVRAVQIADGRRVVSSTLTIVVSVSTQEYHTVARWNPSAKAPVFSAFESSAHAIEATARLLGQDPGAAKSLGSHQIAHNDRYVYIARHGESTYEAEPVVWVDGSAKVFVTQGDRLFIYSDDSGRIESERSTTASSDPRMAYVLHNFWKYDYLRSQYVYNGIDTMISPYILNWYGYDVYRLKMRPDWNTGLKYIQHRSNGNYLNPYTRIVPGGSTPDLTVTNDAEFAQTNAFYWAYRGRRLADEAWWYAGITETVPGALEIYVDDYVSPSCFNSGDVRVYLDYDAHPNTILHEYFHYIAHTYGGLGNAGCVKDVYESHRINEGLGYAFSGIASNWAEPNFIGMRDAATNMGYWNTEIVNLHRHYTSVNCSTTNVYDYGNPFKQALLELLFGLDCFNYYSECQTWYNYNRTYTAGRFRGSKIDNALILVQAIGYALKATDNSTTFNEIAYWMAHYMAYDEKDYSALATMCHAFELHGFDAWPICR